MVSWSMPRRWRVLAMTALIAWSFVGYAMFGELFHVAHLLASVVGFLLGWWWADRGEVSSPRDLRTAFNRSGLAGTPPSRACAAHAPSTEIADVSGADLGLRPSSRS
jgi:hypothetical protein